MNSGRCSRTFGSWRAARSKAAASGRVSQRSFGSGRSGRCTATTRVSRPSRWAWLMAARSTPSSRRTVPADRSRARA